MPKGCTYILLCEGDNYYVGSTTDVELRIKEHMGEPIGLFLGAKITKAHRPIKLVYKEEFETIEEAFRREKQIQKWSRAKKEALINGDIEKLKSQSKHGSFSSVGEPVEPSRKKA